MNTIETAFAEDGRAQTANAQGRDASDAERQAILDEANPLPAFARKAAREYARYGRATGEDIRTRDDALCAVLIGLIIAVLCVVLP